MAEKREGIWGKFDDLIASIPDYIKEQENSVFSGDNSVTSIGNGNKVSYTSKSSVTSVTHGDKLVVITSKNGKTTIKVNGVEYAPKEKK